MPRLFYDYPLLTYVLGDNDVLSLCTRMHITGDVMWAWLFVWIEFSSRSSSEMEIVI